jgi:hypothetical protein
MSDIPTPKTDKLVAEWYDFENFSFFEDDHAPMSWPDFAKLLEQNLHTEREQVRLFRDLRCEACGNHAHPDDPCANCALEQAQKEQAKMTEEHKALRDLYNRSCEAAGMKGEDLAHTLPELCAKLKADLEAEKKKKRVWGSQLAQDVIDGQAASLRRMEDKLNGWFIEKENLEKQISDMAEVMGQLRAHWLTHEIGCRTFYNESCTCGLETLLLKAKP